MVPSVIRNNKITSKYRGAQISILAASHLLVSFHSAHSTVLEYSPGNDVTITETTHIQNRPIKSEHSILLPTRITLDQSKYRKLTRKIAVEYSGSTGVRTAKLDALTFINIFDALINRESNFNPKAISPKGAVGLGQLMPDTAADLGVKDPLDPEANLHGSAKYFTQQLEQFGSLDLALAAYNAGPQRVREFHGIPPFAETRSYIKWIRSKAGLKINKATPNRSSKIKNRSHNLRSKSKGNVSVWEF